MKRLLRSYRLAGPIVATLLAVVASFVPHASVQATSVDTQMPLWDKARSLAAAGQLTEALSIYDDLTASGSLGTALYLEARDAAKGARDMRRFAIYGERQLKIDPDNYELRQSFSMGHQLAGDDAAAERSRMEFISLLESVD